MSQYSSPGGNEVFTVESQRTSIAAVVGFVLSLLGCCMPVGILGAVLGIFGLIGIGRSEGRVGGKGLAVAALIIGVLNTVIWVAAVAGMYSLGSTMISTLAPLGTNVLEKAEAGDFSGARAALGGQNAMLSDEAFQAFQSSYDQSLGAFVSPPGSPLELFSGYLELGQLMQQYQGRNDIIPIPVTFENDKALLILVIDQSGASGNNGMPDVLDVIIVERDGTEHMLSDFGGAAPDTPDPDETEP